MSTALGVSGKQEEVGEGKGEVKYSEENMATLAVQISQRIPKGWCRWSRGDVSPALLLLVPALEGGQSALREKV